MEKDKNKNKKAETASEKVVKPTIVKKAKNLNDLVKAAETKRKIISKIKSRIKMPVLGEIISDYGEGKDQHKLKNGLVFKKNRTYLVKLNEKFDFELNKVSLKLTSSKFTL